MRRLILFWICIVLFFPYALQAKVITFEEQYTYDAGEADSKLTCRAISLVQVKRLLLEKLGVYLESETQVVDFQLTKDQIVSLSAGIVKTEIIDERWDGKTYKMKARIGADPDGIAKELNDLRKNREGRENIENLEEVNEKSMERIEELNRELERMQTDFININRDYQSAAKVVSAWTLHEEGRELFLEGRYSDAISVINQAIEIQPNYIYFFFRGKTYMKLKEFQKAIDDFDKVIEKSPREKDAYFQRGIAFRNIGEKGKGMDDIKKAERLGSGNARRWLKLHE